VFRQSSPASLVSPEELVDQLRHEHDEEDRGSEKRHRHRHVPLLLVGDVRISTLRSRDVHIEGEEQRDGKHLDHNRRPHDVRSREDGEDLEIIESDGDKGEVELVLVQDVRRHDESQQSHPEQNDQHQHILRTSFALAVHSIVLVDLAHRALGSSRAHTGSWSVASSNDVAIRTSLWLVVFANIVTVVAVGIRPTSVVVVLRERILPSLVHTLSQNKGVGIVTGVGSQTRLSGSTAQKHRARVSSAQRGPS
jgi:hypothetical protein